MPIQFKYLHHDCSFLHIDNWFVPEDGIVVIQVIVQILLQFNQKFIVLQEKVTHKRIYFKVGIV